MNLDRKLLLLPVVVMCLSASGEAVAQPAWNQCWSVSISPPNATAQPNDQIRFTLKIAALKDIYDATLKASLSSPQYMKIPSNETVKVPQLKSGQSYEQPFQVLIGTDAPAGEADINFLIEGHDDPSVFGLFRWPWDKPECVSDSALQNFSPFVIHVLRIPSLFVNVSAPGTVGVGDDFDFSTVIVNNGTDTAKSVVAQLSFPSGIAANQSQVRLGDIARGSEVSYRWRLHAVTNGTYQIQVQVMAANANPVKGVAIVTVELKSAMPPLMFRSLVFFPHNLSILVLIGLVLSGIVERRQGFIGRPGIALNSFFLWQMFFNYWTSRLVDDG